MTLFFFPEHQRNVEANSHTEAVEKLEGDSKSDTPEVQGESKKEKKGTSSKK